jgi:hypothetical protein
MAVVQSPYRSYQLEGTPSLTHIYYVDAGGAPASGTYVQGDLALSLPLAGGVAPTATTPLFWRCVTAGSPGTWAAIGSSGVSLGTAIASAATIAPVTHVVHVTGTTTISTITVPVGLPSGGSITLIPDGLWSTTTGGNIAIASTGVVSKSLIMTWDNTQSLWYPSY